jgi:hypothetical protein
LEDIGKNKEIIEVVVKEEKKEKKKNDNKRGRSMVPETKTTSNFSSSHSKDD